MPRTWIECEAQILAAVRANQRVRDDELIPLFPELSRHQVSAASTRARRVLRSEGGRTPSMVRAALEYLRAHPGAPNTELTTAMGLECVDTRSFAEARRRLRHEMGLLPRVVGRRQTPARYAATALAIREALTKDRGLSNAELAGIIGITEGAVSQPARLAREALGIAGRTLFGRMPPVATVPTTEQPKPPTPRPPPVSAHGMVGDDVKAAIDLLSDALERSGSRLVSISVQPIAPAAVTILIPRSERK